MGFKPVFKVVTPPPYMPLIAVQTLGKRKITDKNTFPEIPDFFVWWHCHLRMFFQILVNPGGAGFGWADANKIWLVECIRAHYLLFACEIKFSHDFAVEF